jgi:nucleoside-diphosphate-sugar epimerase
MTDHPSDSSKPEETQMDRTVAVTGGSGKLGRAVVAALIDEGWTVVTFDPYPRRTSEHVSSAPTSPTTARAEVIKIAVDHGVVAAVGRADASCDQTHAAISAGAQTSATPARVLGLGDQNLYRRPGWRSTPP